MARIANAIIGDVEKIPKYSLGLRHASSYCWWLRRSGRDLYANIFWAREGHLAAVRWPQQVLVHVLRTMLRVMRHLVLTVGGQATHAGPPGMPHRGVEPDLSQSCCARGLVYLVVGEHLTCLLASRTAGLSS